jgi:predicted nucleic acid-binding Zn ribbon protein
MFCKKCGKALDENAKFCPVCGESVNHEESGAVISESLGPKASGEMKYIRPKYWVTTTILGILSIVFVAINFLGIPVVHLIGIVLGIVAIVYCKNDQRNYSYYSKTGMITGIIGVISGTGLAIYGMIAGILIAMQQF